MTVWIALMFLSLMLMLMLGYPVAFTLGAIALLFGGVFLGFDFFHLLPLRIWGVMTNFTLLAVPLFIFMGIVLDKSGLAEDLLETMGMLFGRLRGGLADFRGRCRRPVGRDHRGRGGDGRDHGDHCAAHHAAA